MSRRWIKVAALAGLAEGATCQVQFEGESVCLYNLKGEICATQDTCTHADASLSEGFLDGELIECPLHQSTFDIRTGRVMSPPATEPLRVFTVSVDGDDIRLLSSDS